MSNEMILPHSVDAFRVTDNEAHMEGTLLIQDMERLKSSLVNPNGKVAVKIEFGKTKQGLRYMGGHYQSTVTLQCQRCMETFEQPLAGSFLIGMVETEAEADLLPKKYDPLLVEDHKIVILDVIEDELIISLPIVPMHPINECAMALPLEYGETETMETENKENPFKVIELLRHKKRNPESKIK